MDSAKNSAWPRMAIMVIGIIALVIVSWLGWNYFSSSQNQSLLVQNCSSINRESYGVNPVIFEELPSPPACFYTVVDAFRSGDFLNPFFFDKTYYLQPEFFPLFEREGLAAWKYPSAGVWGAVGYGAHPSSLSFSLLPGQRIRTRLFIFSSMGIRTYQGMRIAPFFPNPVDEAHVTISILGKAGNGFIVGPNFPKFSSMWVQPVDIEIRAAENIPPETLRARLVVKSPESATDEQGIEKYGSNYFPATAYVGERSPAEITITILPEK